MKTCFKTDILIYLILFGTCIFILLQGSLVPYAKSVLGIDSSIFIYISKRILEGQLLYKDLIDQKGPFLYVINVLALFIFNGKTIGIFIFEVISLFVASIMMYKTARFFTSKFISLLAVIISILSLVLLLIGGNFTEEWALPYISIALYIFVADLKGHKSINITRLFVLSLTFALTLMLRVNLVAIWAGFGIVLLIKWIKEKKFNEIIKYLSFILLFIFLSLLPFILYLFYTGTLSDAFYIVIVFNMFEYGPATENIFRSGFKILLGVTYYLNVIPVILVIYMFLREKTMLNWGLMVAFAITIVSCSIGGRYNHYFIIFTPLLVIPHAYIFTIIRDSFPKMKNICLLILFIFYSYSSTRTQVKIILENFSEQGYSAHSLSPSTMKKLKEVIIQNSQIDDKILVNTLHAYIYLYSDRNCATRFLFPLKDSSLFEKNYVTEVSKALPELIIEFSNEYFGDALSLKALLNEKYHLIESIDDELYDVEVWKLNE